MIDSLLIFSGGELQLSLIRKAKELGYKTIVIDPDFNAVAKNISDVFEVVAGNDFQKTLEIATKYKVKGLVTTSTDHPILMMCKIATELNLPFPSYDSCEILLDKGLFKSFLNKHNLLHAQGAVFCKDDKINETDFNYPLIVKPVKNSGSRGVVKCEKKDNLINLIKETLIFCNDNRFIIEEFIAGDEISVEALVYENQVHIIQITDKVVSTPPFNVELGHLQPSKYCSRIEEIKSLLQKIVDFFGINNCAIHPELKINDDRIFVIEIGPRLGGDYITAKLVPLSTGINMEELVIKIATNSNFSYKKINRASLISYLNFPINEIVKNSLSERELVQVFPEVTEFVHNLKVGDPIRPITNSLNRYGHYIIQANNVASIKKLVSEINEYILKRFFDNY